MFMIVALLGFANLLPKYIDWPLFYEHPARWYFHCLLSSRLFVVLSHKVGLTRNAQAVLVYPYALLLAAFLNVVALAFATLMGHSRGLLFTHLFVCLHDPFQLAKYAACVITYVLCFSWLPPVVDYLGKRSPLTKSRQKIFGALFWAIFVGFCIFEKQLLARYESFWIVYGAECVSRDMSAEFCLRSPVLWKLPFAIMRGLLLAAAVAFLPLTAVPQLAYGSLFGALLAMPLTVSPFVRRTLLQLFTAESAVVQLLAILLIYTMYICTVAHLFQKGWEGLQTIFARTLHLRCQHRFKLLGFQATS